jgi:quercetin dioxygenase-like cupin family protein
MICLSAGQSFFIKLERQVFGRKHNHKLVPIRGVRLRRLVSAAESGRRFTTLLVSVDPQARMLAHRHESEFEQHLVLSGDGQMNLQGQIRDYRPGSLAVIPQVAEHSVAAGEHGVVLLALFSPALT